MEEKKKEGGEGEVRSQIGREKKAIEKERIKKRV